MSPGVSNDSSVRTNRISNTEAALGNKSRSVTRLNVCQVFAPDISADSSSDGSIDLNAAAISRNASGTCPTELTQIIPGSEKTLNGADSRFKSAFSQTFRYPNFGLSKKIQAIASRTP